MVVINEGFLLNCFVSWLAHHVREKLCFSNLETRQKETESDFRVNSKTLDLRSSRPPVNDQGQLCFEVRLFESNSSPANSIMLYSKIWQKTRLYRVSNFYFTSSERISKFSISFGRNRIVWTAAN